MKYHIDTIPVWDAIKLDGECFLCALRRKLELRHAESFLGASVMEPDVRIRVNEKGFCQRHHAMMMTMENKLGHALMMESHTQVTRDKLSKLSERLNKAAKAAASAPLGKLSRAGAAAQKEMTALLEECGQLSGSCILCETIDGHMERYLHAVLQLWAHDSDFRRAFGGCKGFCLPHMTALLRTAQTDLGSREMAEFTATVTRLEEENFSRMQEEIAWFIKKFDYRYMSEPWKNSHDALPRAINKLRGWCVGDEPNPKE